MRADPLVGIKDRDRHAVERPTSRGVGSRSGLREGLARSLGVIGYQPFIVE